MPALEVTSTSFQSLLSLVSVVVIAVAARPLFKYLQWRINRPPYPPGPAPRWLIGNLFDIPTQNVPQEYIEWGNKYNSDILHANALGNHIIVLNKRADVEELFERRGSKYSGRPPVPIASLLGWDWNFVLFPYGPFWRQHLKICKQNFGPASVRQFYEPIITSCVGNALRGLLDHPEMFDDCCKTFAVSIPLMSMYGYRPESLQDPVVCAATEAMAIGASLFLPGATLINILPFLKHIPTWFPGASARRLAEKALRIDEEGHALLLGSLKSRMTQDDGTISTSESEPSLIGRLLSAEARGDPVPADEHKASHNVARTIYSAASDTTHSITLSFIYLMATHPEVQRKAQAEIDQVVGARRLPNLADRDSLPYVEALYREVMRHSPPVPAGLPHQLTEGDVYKGFFFPKGSIVIANLKAICTDKEIYEDPHAFKPERFFDASGALLESDPIIAFGIGRRACPGLHLASASMWLFIASILYSFNIQKAKDAQGREVEIQDDYIDFGVVQRKKYFQCSIVPRSAEASDLIKRTS